MPPHLPHLQFAIWHLTSRLKILVLVLTLERFCQDWKYLFLFLKFQTFFLDWTFCQDTAALSFCPSLAFLSSSYVHLYLITTQSCNAMQWLFIFCSENNFLFIPLVLVQWVTAPLYFVQTCSEMGKILPRLCFSVGFSFFCLSYQVALIT